jgi:hypothetical protein
MREVTNFLFEAGVLAANFQSAAHRAAAAKCFENMSEEAFASLIGARAHLARAIRSAALGVAHASCNGSRAAAAEALRALVTAARREPESRPHSKEGRPWWVG